MGKFIFTLIAIVLVVQIFREKGVNKLIWYFIGILFFPTAIPIIKNPSVNFPHFIAYSLLAATLIQNKDWVQEFKKFPLRNALLIILLALLMIGFADSRLALYLKFYRPFGYFLTHFLVIFLPFLYIRDKKDVVFIFDKLIIMFLFMGIYGLLNVVTGRSEYMSFITSSFGGFDGANLNMNQGRMRFRIASFTSNPIYYGYLLSAILLVFLFILNFVNMHRKKGMYILIFLLLLANLMLTNSRTPLVAFIGGASLFILFALKLKNQARILVACIFLLFFGASLFPSVFKIVDKTLQTFTSEGANSDGSSLEMREMQLAASLVVFYQEPVWGHGFSYIIEGLGYAGDASEKESDSDFKGFESYAYMLLIEQGLVGIVGNLLFFSLCFIWLLRIYKKVDVLGKKFVVLSIAMLFSVLFFALGTGELGSFLFFMSLFSINIKAILLCRHNTKHDYVKSLTVGHGY